MGREKHTASIDVWLEPSEHSEDAEAWNALRERVTAFVAGLSESPEFEDVMVELEFSHPEAADEELARRWRYCGGTGPVAQVGDLVEVDPTTIPFDRPKWTIGQRGRVKARVDENLRLRLVVSLEGREAAPVTLSFEARDLSLIQEAGA
jgi:hypothetical protein